MTAQGSAKSGVFYKFLPYYLTKLRYLKPQIIMNSIFALLSYPLFMGILNGYIAAEINRNDIQDKISLLRLNNSPVSEEFSASLRAANDAVNTMVSLTAMGAIIGGLCLVGLFVFTFVTTLRGFRYLYDKSAVDMDYSLPVNHNTRFFADLSAVFSASIIPHLISVLIGLILLQVFHGQVSAYEPDWVQMSKVCTSVATQCAFTGIFSCIMQIGFTLLMISVCGKKAEAGLYPVLLNIAVPVIHILCVTIVEMSVYGSSGEFSLISAVSTSPVGMIVMTIFEAIRCTSSSNIYDMSSEAADAITMPVYQPIYGIIALLLTLAFLAGAYFLIKHRRTERVGMPYVYKGMGLVIPGVIILTIALPISNVIFAAFRNNGTEANSYTPNPAGLIAGLLISTFIVYVIMELISGRAFRRFHITVAKWAGTVAVCAGISAVLTYSNGFGMAYYVPDPGSVEQASVRIQGYDPGGNYNYNNGYHFGFALSYDPEAIKTVTEVHKLIPKDGKPVNYLGTGYSDTFGDYGWVSIIYRLKNGGEVGRMYPIGSAEELEKYLRAAITPDTWYEMCIGEDISQMSVKPEQTEVTYVDCDWADQIYQTNALSISELAEVIKQDSQKVTYEIAADQSVKEYNLNLEYSVEERGDGSDYNYGGWLNVKVYSWMDSTIRYLKECGLRFDYSQYRTAYLLKSNNGEDIKIAAPGDIMALDEGITSAESEEKYGISVEDTDMNYSFVKLDMDSVGFKELIEGASDRAPANDFCIVLLMAESYDEYITKDNRSNLLGVTGESYDLAEKLFSQGQIISAA